MEMSGMREDIYSEEEMKIEEQLEESFEDGREMMRRKEEELEELCSTEDEEQHEERSEQGEERQEAFMPYEFTEKMLKEQVNMKLRRGETVQVRRYPRDKKREPSWKPELYERLKSDRFIVFKGKLEQLSEEYLGYALWTIGCGDVPINIVEKEKCEHDAQVLLEMGSKEQKDFVISRGLNMHVEGLLMEDHLTWKKRRTRHNLIMRELNGKLGDMNMALSPTCTLINGVQFLWNDTYERWE